MPITSHDIKFVIDAIKSPDVVASMAGEPKWPRCRRSVAIVDDKTYPKSF